MARPLALAFPLVLAFSLARPAAAQDRRQAGPPPLPPKAVSVDEQTDDPEGVEGDADDHPAHGISQYDTWGAVAPGRGFEVARTDIGNLNVSVYSLVRYLNQLPAEQTFTDHLGRTQPIDTRNDIQLHRILLNFMGFIYDPKFNYVVTVWTVNSTGDVNVVGNLSYEFSKALRLSGGINGLPGTRTMLGSHPHWLGHDRVMADEFFRPGFVSGAWISGEVLPRLEYQVMVASALSQIRINAQQLTRDPAVSGSVWWMPTTGEFGPRGGFGDYEEHTSLATRIGTSFTHHREDRFSDISQRSPDNTQVRISDSLLLFQTDTLAPGVTVQKANFDLLAADIGFKWRGFFLQYEHYLRWLTNFQADGPLPVERIFDQGFYVQASQMVVPRLLELYAATSHVLGQFGDAHEVLGGTNYYPFDTRNMRLNAQGIWIRDSAASSLFGYYVGGQRGVTLSVAASVLF